MKTNQQTIFETFTTPNTTASFSQTIYFIIRSQHQTQTLKECIIYSNTQYSGYGHSTYITFISTAHIRIP